MRLISVFAPRSSPLIFSPNPAHPHVWRTWAHPPPPPGQKTNAGAPPYSPSAPKTPRLPPAAACAAQIQLARQQNRSARAHNAMPRQPRALRMQSPRHLPRRPRIPRRIRNVAIGRNLAARHRAAPAAADRRTCGLPPFHPLRLLAFNVFLRCFCGSAAHRTTVCKALYLRSRCAPTPQRTIIRSSMKFSNPTLGSSSFPNPFSASRTTLPAPSPPISPPVSPSV